MISALAKSAGHAALLGVLFWLPVPIQVALLGIPQLTSDDWL